MSDGQKKCCDAAKSCDTDAEKKPCCGGIAIKGMLLGAVIMFVWNAVSWMVLPWHNATLNTFQDEAAVAKALTDNAETSGIFTLPFISPDAAPAFEKPFAFLSVTLEGAPLAMGPQLAAQFVLCLLIAGLLTCLLKKQSTGCPVAFSFKIAVLVALAQNIPLAIWWHFPWDFTLINFADSVIAITLAGMAIATCVLGKKAGCCPTQKKEGCCDKNDGDSSKKGCCG
ncbi:MAG: hypothetical protein OXT65_04495 [Alphaproteobacteria bacterium]|nr:hypothetical protein [Alphaproteobacteria bacterium]